MKTTFFILSLVGVTSIFSFGKQPQSNETSGNSTETDRVAFVSDFFRLLQSSAPPGAGDEEKMFSGLHDVKACLESIPKYKSRKTPIWDFLRSKKGELFGSSEQPFPVSIY